MTNSGDYSVSPVPQGNTVSGLRLAKMITGIAISIPLLISAAQVGSALGLVKSIAAFLAGGMVLALIGACAAAVGSKTKLTTYLIVQFPFGTHGAKVVNAVIGLTIFGWYSVTAAMFGRATYAAVIQAFGTAGGLGEMEFVLAGSVLMISVTVFGFRALDRVASAAVPVLALFLAYLVFASFSRSDLTSLLAQPADAMPFGMATSAVVGGFIVGVVVFPDFLRFARNVRHGITAAVLSMGLALPLIYMAAAIPSVATGQGDLVTLLIGMGLGIPALLLLILATVTTNTFNLYSSSLVLASVVPRAPLWALTVASGLAGTIVAVSGATDAVETFLIGLSVLMPPIAGIYIMDFFALARQRFELDSLPMRSKVGYVAFIAWIGGIAIGYASAAGELHLSRIPAIDALLGSSFIHVALSVGARFCARRSSSVRAFTADPRG